MTRLRDCRTSALRSVARFLLDEAAMSGEVDCQHEEPVLLALAAILDDELRIRDPRRKPMAGAP